MHIVIAPDKFKGSLTAKDAATYIADGIKRVFPTAAITKIPMADGGEGTVQSLVDATGGRIIEVQVTGPLGTLVTAGMGILGDGKTAVIEMAKASGLTLVPEDLRDPRITTTRGTGELLLAAAEIGCSSVIVGIGGSATNDGGAGMAQVLGVRLLDAHGQELGHGGINLAQLDRIDDSGLDPRIKEMEIIVACDVTNPLCGPTGASAVYGPQKGATPEMVRHLDAALANYAKVKKRDLGKEIAEIPGSGAAGGLGAGMLAFLSAKLQRGVQIVIDVVGLEEAVKDCDLVVTGEGGVDAQTAYGKAPAGVAEVAYRYGKPVIIIAGSVADDATNLHDHGIHAIISLVRRPMSLADAIRQTPTLLTDSAEQVARLIKLGAEFLPAKLE
jgi:glycerate kinase